MWIIPAFRATVTRRRAEWHAYGKSGSLTTFRPLLPKPTRNQVGPECAIGSALIEVVDSASAKPVAELLPFVEAQAAHAVTWMRRPTSVIGGKADMVRTHPHARL